MSHCCGVHETSFSSHKFALEVITLTDFAGLLMSFEPECSASVLSHTFQLFELHRGGDPSAKSACLGKLHMTD